MKCANIQDREHGQVCKGKKKGICVLDESGYGDCIDCSSSSIPEGKTLKKEYSYCSEESNKGSLYNNNFDENDTQIYQNNLKNNQDNKTIEDNAIECGPDNHCESGICSDVYDSDWTVKSICYPCDINEDLYKSSQIDNSGGNSFEFSNCSKSETDNLSFMFNGYLNDTVKKINPSYREELQEEAQASALAQAQVQAQAQAAQAALPPTPTEKPLESCNNLICNPGICLDHSTGGSQKDQKYSCHPCNTSKNNTPSHKGIINSKSYCTPNDIGETEDSLYKYIDTTYGAGTLEDITNRENEKEATKTICCL